MLTVSVDAERVERDLGSGRLACPGCGAALARWGYARPRRVRDGEGWWRLRPRRGICTGCRATHVLLPTSCLLRRADAVAVIGVAVTAKADGLGHRRIAEWLGRSASTVRGWLRAFAGRVEQVRAVFTALLYELDPLAEPVPLAGSGFTDAVEAIGAVAAAVSGGRLLAPARSRSSPNTSWLWAAVS